MIKYCPLCNASSSEVRFVGEFCENCLIKEAKKKIKEDIKIEFCKRCDRLKVKGTYIEKNEKNLGAAMLEALDDKKCMNVVVNSLNKDEVNLNIKYMINDDYIKFDKIVRYKMIHQICQDCYRRSSGYYEAIIQLRGDEQRIDKIIEKIETFLSNNNAFVSKIEKLENNGIDLYISDKTLIKTFFIAHKLKPKASYTLYSIKNGKKVYRNTYFLKFEK
ncbi:MAG: NMD3-related protein [Candidatus Micrarchaeia archaeon]